MLKDPLTNTPALAIIDYMKDTSKIILCVDTSGDSLRTIL